MTVEHWTTVLSTASPDTTSSVELIFSKYDANSD